MHLHRLASTVAVAAAALLVGAWASAQSAPPSSATAGSASAAEIFKDADLPLGEKLIREHQCTECHVRRLGGDGSAIYRPQGRISSPGALRGMVEQCNTELNLGMFPEEVSSVAAVLQRDHYRFGMSRPAQPAKR